jgi:hypothetical protein
MYYEEFLKIALALQQKASSYKTNSIIIYSDNQAALKALQKADPTSAQNIFQ